MNYILLPLYAYIDDVLLRVKIVQVHPEGDKQV